MTGLDRDTALDQLEGVGDNANMQAVLLLRERRVVAEGRFAEIIIWRVPSSIRGSSHEFKYRLAFIADGVCVLRFDNEAGMGDHKHVGDLEVPYAFRDLEHLIDDFWYAVENWRPK